MKSKNKCYYFIIIFLLVFSQKTTAQVEVFVKNALEKISGGHSHVILDLNSPQASEFSQVYKKYWTLTQGVDFIDSRKLQENLVAGDSYFSLETSMVSYGGSGTVIFYYLNLWVPKEKALKKVDEFDIQDEISIAHIQLSVHGDIGKRTAWPNFGADKNINNWNPGILKNYLQQLSSVIKTGKKFLSDDITNKTQLKLLKDQTLYCSEDDFYLLGTLGKVGKLDGAQMEKLFDGYKSSYKIITSQELGDKILADSEQFYYFLYVHGTDGGKLMLVVNSRTGELLYSRSEISFSHNIKSGDLKDLYNKIK